MVYYLAQSSSQGIGNLETWQADAVKGTIKLNGNGNLSLKQNMNDTDFTISLSNCHEPN